MSFLIIKRFFLLIIKALLTEKMLMRFMVIIGDYLVNRNTNELVDDIWADAREALEKAVGD